MTILKPSELHADTGTILDQAIHAPVYVERGGTVLVITKADLAPVREDASLTPWELRANAIESFYDSAEAW
jgi:hypothetical protein